MAIAKRKPAEPVRIELKKEDTVKVISGRDKGKTGRVLQVNRENGQGAGGARDDDQASHPAQSGQADQGRHRGAREPDQRVQRDDRLPGVRQGRARRRIMWTWSPAARSRRTRVCRKCGQTLDRK